MKGVINLKEYKLNKKKVDNMDLQKFAKLVLYFANNTKTRLYKTKLKKLLFYAQFLFYKNFREDLLKTEFVCDYFGPVIEDIDYRLNEIERMGLIEFKNTAYGKYVEAEYDLAENNYTREELLILNRVAKKFDNFSASEISEYSHKEPLWIEAGLKEVIPLELADRLNEF